MQDSCTHATVHLHPTISETLMPFYAERRAYHGGIHLLGLMSALDM